jgi:hypothetical protein
MLHVYDRNIFASKRGKLYDLTLLHVKEKKYTDILSLSFILIKIPLAFQY